MEASNRFTYIWMMVWLTNIATVLALILLSYTDIILLVIPVLLFMTVVPVLISKSQSKFKNHFGYGIPILLLLPLPHFIFNLLYCSDFFCELMPTFFVLGLGISAIIFAFFYTMGINKTPRFVILLIKIILLISFIYISLLEF